MDTDNVSDTSSHNYDEGDDDDDQLQHHRQSLSQRTEKETLKLAKTEDTWVWRLRILTAFVLVGVTVTACLVVYFQSRNAEQRDFEEDFQSLGEKLVSSFEVNVKQRFGVISGFGMDITAQSDGAFPFVTPAHYVARLDKLSQLSHVMYQMYLPRVAPGQLEAWNNYSAVTQDWVDEGVGYSMGIDPSEVNAPPIVPQIMDVHWGGPPRPDQGPGPYYPIWGSYPIFNNTMTFNANLFNDMDHKGPMLAVESTKRPSFEKSFDYIQGEIDSRYEIISSHPTIDFQDDPIALAFFPIFDNFGENRTVAAQFLVFIYWRTYFNELLPPGADGVLVILENTCDQQYTYQIDGTVAKFYGHGDLHDEKYDYLGVGTTVDSIIDNVDSDYGEVGCRYSIRAYPSDVFEESYYTSRPWVYSLILASLFVFTTGVFLLYDCMVQRRQKIVMKSAVQSGTLVNSLFPEAVRDQLYAEQQADNSQNNNNNNSSDKAKSSAWQVKNNDKAGESKEQKEAIARLYPETTIFFADMVGFTEWSSTRTPTEVFHLLETLYGAFDDVAMKRGIFKVETIGDCYVAAAGLPDPRQDHAVAMVKFASTCLMKMRELMIKLSESLGDDTESLGMRVGLHSGPVTAGVLRGQKSRFQLFGDTVNTTARMETNGTEGRIHVSQATADELIAAGKSSWLSTREGTITVKGKGEMQTYWASVPELTNKTSMSIVSASS